MISSFLVALKMKPRTKGTSSGQKAQDFQGEGRNWILIAGGALLSTLSIHLGYKLKQTMESKQQANASNSLKGVALFIASARFLQYYLAITFEV